MYIKYHNWAIKLWIVIKFTVISFKYMFTSDNFTAKNCHIKLELSQNVMKTLTLQLHTKRNLVHQMMAKTFCWWYNTVLVKFRYQQFEILIQKIIQDNSFDQKAILEKKRNKNIKTRDIYFVNTNDWVMVHVSYTNSHLGVHFCQPIWKSPNPWKKLQ